MRKKKATLCPDQLIAEAAQEQKDAVLSSARMENAASQAERFVQAINSGMEPEEQAYMAGMLEGMLSALRMMKVSA